jgi:hypothetical protein
LEDLLGVRGQCRKDNINSLSQVSATDSVHYTKEGYENLANAIDAIICTKEKISAGYDNVGTAVRRGTFIWRGFTSPVGSARPRFSATSCNAIKRGC